MIFGEEIKLPVDIATEKVDIGQSSVPKTQAEYVRKLERSLNEMYDIVRDVTGKLSFRQKRYYDRDVHSTNYDIGDLVRRNQPKVLKVLAKLNQARKWTGPWIVVERLSDVLYKIQVSKRSKPVMVHSDNLNLYKQKRSTEGCSKRTKIQNAPEKVLSRQWSYSIGRSNGYRTRS